MASKGPDEGSEILLRDFGVDLLLGQASLVHEFFSKFGSPAGSSPANSGMKRSAPYELGGAEKASRANFPGAEPPASPGQRPNRWSPALAPAPPAAGTSPVSQRPAATGTTKKESTRALVHQLKAELTSFAPGKAPPYIQQWLDEKYRQTELRPALQQLSREYCRNCIMAGKGVVTHTFAQCRAAGNACVLPCPKCVQAGRLQDIYHWLQDCPGN